MSQHQAEPAYQLPYKKPDKEQRTKLLKIYAAKLWRLNQEHSIVECLNDLYEEAYGNGLRDMDLLHKAIDVMIDKTIK
ncbi:hypothetical protein [Segetibacter aerophilus]|uniref:Uncharacterized protein n=1 Tax=Segetibacter aerophilus TaxID=670293 RepID=A0A512BA68_9BACT|nr:hypothetical protein [Segetibacter aerophilus]GEO08727.1 hypothetical protein SAE01_12230 [Segetibacter aerophilus]